MKKEKGITLIALVITIIVLLILVAVSIVSFTGENGILNKAMIAQRNTEIAEIRERIRLELIGGFDGENMNYTNQDVINAVEKVTGSKITENTPIVDDIDISDFWIKEEIKEEAKYYFMINDVQCYFTNKDAGFQYDESGKAMFYYDEWLNHHVSGISCTPIIDGMYQIVDEKLGFIDMIDYHTLRKEGTTVNLDVSNLKSRIYYDND